MYNGLLAMLKFSKLLLTSLICLLALLGGVSAQEWGVIPEREWHARPPAIYADDGAIVIFDFGLAKTEVSGLDFTRHTRILAYTDSGLTRVRDVTIEYFDYDKLHDLRAQVVSPDGTVHELGEDEFLTDRIGSRRVTHFRFFPAQPGDILEYSYRIEYYAGRDKLGREKLHLFSQDEWYSQYKKREDNDPRVIRSQEELKKVTNLPSWYFDHAVYCLKSRYTAQLGGDVDYIYYTTNVRRSKQEPVTEPVKVLLATAYQKHSWSLTKIPAYKRDTSVTWDDEAQRVGLHFRLYAIYGRNRVLRTNYSDEHWKNVGESMQGYTDEYCNRSKKMMKQARRLVAKLPSDLDKVNAIYGYIVDNFAPDSTGFILRPSHTGLKQLYDEKIGMPFELNLLLVEMLKMAGFESWPVLISTRDKVSFRKSGLFNHMLAMVNVGDGSIIMDASSDHCPLGSLPPLSAVEEGVLVDYSDSHPIAFTTKICQ